MKPDISALTVDQVIVHEVTSGNEGEEGSSAVLSEVVDDPGAEVREFYRFKVMNSLTEVGRAIQFRQETTSPVPELVRGLFDDQALLLENSQACARHLADCQVSGAISPGLLCASIGTLAKSPAITIVKLEIEEGIQLRRGRKQGKRSLTMLNVKDLMLSDNTRVFKAAMFYRSGRTVRGIVSDHQVPRTSIRGVARFFVDQFLGAELEELPEVTTGRYYEAALDFANSQTDPEKRYRYDAAMHTDLLSNATSVAPVAFARKYIDQEDRTAFFKVLEERNIDKAGFDKDVARIEAQIRKRRLEFKSGLQLVGPTKSFDEHVEHTKKAVTVRDEVVRVGQK